MLACLRVSFATLSLILRYAYAAYVLVLSVRLHDMCVLGFVCLYLFLIVMCILFACLFVLLKKCMYLSLSELDCIYSKTTL